MFHPMSISIILTEKAIRKQVCTLVKIIPITCPVLPTVHLPYQALQFPA